MTLWTAAHQVPLSSTVSQSLLKFIFIKSVMLSNHLILWHSLLLLSSFLKIRVFSNESALCIRWPKYWNFSTSTSNEYSTLISFRVDWFDLVAIQGTLKSLLQHHNSEASILQHSVKSQGLPGPFMVVHVDLPLCRLVTSKHEPLWIAENVKCLIAEIELTSLSCYSYSHSLSSFSLALFSVFQCLTSNINNCTFQLTLLS